MEMTSDYFMEKFHEFNKVYFNNEIKPIKAIVFSKTKSLFGSMNYSKWIIHISLFYERDEKDYLNTLIHEMCHAYAYQKYKCNGHGNAWKRVAAAITRKTGGVYGNIQRTGGGDIKCEISTEFKKESKFLLFTDCYGKFAVAKFTADGLVDKFVRRKALKKETPYYIISSTDDVLCKLPTRSASDTTSCYWSYIKMNLDDILGHEKTKLLNKVG